MRLREDARKREKNRGVYGGRKGVASMPTTRYRGCEIDSTFLRIWAKELRLRELKGKGGLMRDCVMGVGIVYL